MTRLLMATALAGLFAATAVQADIGPPKGQKRVPIDHKVTTEKEFPDYIFFTVLGSGGKDKTVAAKAVGVTQVKLDPKTPVEIKGEGRGGGVGNRQGSLSAVPKDAGKSYGSEKEFLAAIRAGKVDGQLRLSFNFDPVITIKDTDPRKLVLMEYQVEKVNPKDGLVLKFLFKEDKKEPAKKAGKNAPEDEDESDAAVADAPKGGAWIAGVATTLAVAFTGLWLVGRNRRRD